MSTAALGERAAPRVNRVAVWVSALVCFEGAVGAAILLHQALDDVPVGARVFWSVVLMLSVAGAHNGFWTVVWALRTRPLRLRWAWAAFVVMMVSVGMAAFLVAVAVVDYLYPLS